MELTVLNLAASCSIVVGAALAALMTERFSLALIGLIVGIHPLILHALYQMPLEPEQLTVQLAVIIGSIGTVLLFNRWPTLWLITSASLLYAVRVVDFEIEQQMLIISIYLAWGVIAPAITAFLKTREFDLSIEADPWLVLIERISSNS